MKYDVNFKEVKHHHNPGDFHEFTFSCYRGIPLLTNNLWREKLSRTLESACEEACVELIAFVYMPEHVHLLTFPLEAEPEFELFLSRTKQPLSKFVKNELAASKSPMLTRLTVRERRDKHSFRFWQEGPGFDRNLFSRKAIESSIDYIHNNPVKRGLCQKATDWKWSSARFFHLDPPCQQFPELPRLHKIRPETFDRDAFR
jgi:putative transposase